MEPTTMTATAIGSLLLVKIGEGAATEVGKQVFEKFKKLLSPLLHEKAKKLLSLLRIKLPNAAKAIEQAPELPLDMNTIEVELQTAIQSDDELANAVWEIDKVVKEDPELTQAVTELVDDIKSQPSGKQNFTNFIEKVVNLVQGTGASINIDKQDIHF
ncbi:hypothetical protein [Calothrix sp. PCC 6303]|uniref:hypothetical protein n=1 Tax=Calothrix sp. PCC 6303 TaxID=1170562 RepID=UPI0002A007B2|nr:hypothetical protein [Calothrix sp. PCC 6303]AFZ04608.1 hypothetical protein Cal6303_5743 [Calothrix sp. PCC 6303]